MNFVSSIYRDVKINAIHARKYSKYYVYGDPLADMLDYINRHEGNKEDDDKETPSTYDQNTMRIYLDACMRTGIKIPDSAIMRILNVFFECNLRWPIWQLVDSLCPNMVLISASKNMSNDGVQKCDDNVNDLIKYLWPHTNDLISISPLLLVKFIDDDIACYLADIICARNMHVDHHEMPNELVLWVLSLGYIIAVKFLMHIMQDIDISNDIIVNYMCAYALGMLPRENGEYEGSPLLIDFLSKHMFVSNEDMNVMAEKII